MAADTLSRPAHPGTYVRDEILTPRDLSVTDAAKVLGIGRQALSRFLNGTSSLSSDMAERIERAFLVPAQDLLDMQAAHDGAKPREGSAASVPMPYVPRFLSVLASDIETWAGSRIAARTRLAVFLRTLVNSTGIDLSRVNFPGNDDGERPGWDGEVVAGTATPWIPQGRSGWEFGTNSEVGPKANGDYEKSVRAVDEAERMDMTFVFVTPRRWKGKDTWARKMEERGEWKAVRAYDASDLEQWVEQSAAGQIWFKEETGQAADRVRTLSRCWADWANATIPELHGALFDTAVSDAEKRMAERLTSPSREPTIVAADSAGEALAFLAQLFERSEVRELQALRDRIIAFDAKGPLARLALGSQEFVAVITDPGVEQELAGLDDPPRAIVLRSRNSIASKPHVMVEPIGHDALRQALREMKLDGDEADRLFRECGGSLTILRRRLSKLPGVQSPAWSTSSDATEQLIPFAFAGAWDVHVESDREVLGLLGNDTFENVETQFRRWASIDDAPVWSEGTYRGVVSKIDVLFSIARSITAQHLDRFFSIARMILGEDDPKLDLPEDDRWMAGIYGKQREFSEQLRAGIGETVVLLAVHGDDLFRATTGFRCASAAEQLVRDVMTPLSQRTLEANQRDLPVYAEAAPELFLRIIEEDLRSEKPEVYGLMGPSDVGVFGSCPRSGLLWALEGLAWNANTMHRVALILAKLAALEIKDNWGNTPASSLGSIFCAWMPQTEADHDQRLNALQLIADHHPKVAWRICVAQLRRGSHIGQYSHKPRWRADGRGFGEPHKEWEPIDAFLLAEMQMAITWPSHDADTIFDLIECLHRADDGDRQRIWDLISRWASKSASDSDKARIREKVRVTLATRRGRRRAQATSAEALAAEAAQALTALEPSDLILRHLWLFRDSWVEESADEADDAVLDLRSREDRIALKRTEALREVIDSRGIEGAVEIANRGNAAFQVGHLLAIRLLDDEAVTGVLRDHGTDRGHAGDGLGSTMVSGILWGLNEIGRLGSVLDKIADDIDPPSIVGLLLLAPFETATWTRVAQLDEADREQYWAEVVPSGLHKGHAANDVAQALIQVGRPRAAFCCLHHDLGELNVTVLFQLLSEIAKATAEESDRYRLDRYYVRNAFTLIDAAPNLTLDQKAELELAYIDVLSEPWSRHEPPGVPNLERYVELHPEMFVRALVWTYKRASDGEDPPEWTVPEDLRETLATRGHSLLDAVTKIPGSDAAVDVRAERLREWIGTVRDAARDLDRLDIADQKIGLLLSKCPAGDDGVWPNEIVRNMLEELRSEHAMRGAHTGVYNSRGVIARGEGGQQERDLAGKYRRWAEALQYRHPFVASRLLDEIVKTYEHEAESWEAEAAAGRRLRT